MTGSSPDWASSIAMQRFSAIQRGTRTETGRCGSGLRALLDGTRRVVLVTRVRAAKRLTRCSGLGTFRGRVVRDGEQQS